MTSFLSENRVTVLAIALLSIFLFLLSAQIRLPDSGARVQAGILAVVSPVARGTASLVDGLRSLWRGYVDLRGAREETERLKREITALRLEANLLEDLAGENQRLTRLLDLEARPARPILAARIIGIDLSGPSHTALLDKGSDQGVARDDPVITPEGVVGRVTAVTGSLAKVQLLIDRSSGAGGVCAASRVQGLVVGHGVNALEMRYVPGHVGVEPGDVVETSGLDGIYPKGLAVGVVSEVIGGDALEQRVFLKPVVDFRRLEEVIVLREDGTSSEDAASLASRAP
jgi:rod shape-determining protein MreC